MERTSTSSKKGVKKSDTSTTRKRGVRSQSISLVKPIIVVDADTDSVSSTRQKKTSGSTAPSPRRSSRSPARRKIPSTPVSLDADSDSTEEETDASSDDEAPLSSSSLTTSGNNTGAPSSDIPNIPVSPAKKWRDWWIRLATTFPMIGLCIALVLAIKQPGVVVLIFFLQALIYKELVSLAVRDSKEKDLPGFRAFYWYWFIVAAFFMYVKSMGVYMLSAIRGISINHVLSMVREVATGATHTFEGDTTPITFPTIQCRSYVPLANGLIEVSVTDWDSCSYLNRFKSIVDWVISYYEPLSYILYMAGFVAFVISLRQRRNFRYQFSQFAYCHIALALVVGQSTVLAENVFNGLIWFVIPIGLVVCNDSFAYVFGFFFGRTPLIRISPKKTVEGFIGGGLATVLFAFVATHICTQTEIFNVNKIMTCPVLHGVGFTLQDCDVSTQANRLYVEYPLSQWRLFASVGLPEAVLNGIKISEMQWHAAALAIFASLVAPFGGFFASGFKRALKVKDFGNAIPGHGGFTDRMDCQLIMGAFSYIYCIYIIGLRPGHGLGQRETVQDLVTHYFSLLVQRLSVQDLQQLHTMLGDFLKTQ